MTSNEHQPRGLSIFFLSEMWERYGFYTLQGLLALFLSKVFNFTDNQSYAIAGSFTALSYIAPIIGGYLADSILGYRHSVILGGLLLCAGYASLASSHAYMHFFTSLSIISIGTGLFKPNVSSLLGTLYRANDTRREAGYTFFYVGINVGTILATSLSGFIVEYYGWGQAFLTAAIVLAVGTLTFTLGTQHFDIYDYRPIRHTWFKNILAYLLIIVLIGLGSFIIRDTQWALLIFSAVMVAVVVVLLYNAILETKVQRKRIIAYMLLIGISIVFWSIYFQLFLSLDLFIDRAVDHDILGFQIPTVAFLGIESLGIILFGPILGAIWTWLNNKKLAISFPGKFTLGVFFVCLSFGSMILGINKTAAEALMNPAWIFLSYGLLAIGELSLSPIGLAMVTELAPPRLVGMMMGIFFVSLGLGGKIAGVLADYAAIPKDLTDLNIIKQVYANAFTLYASIALVATVICLLLVPFIKRLISPKMAQSDLPIL